MMDCDLSFYDFVKSKTYPDRQVATIKVGILPPQNCDRTRKPIEDRHVSTARVSARRTSQTIYDIISCNNFNFFITLTLGTQSRLSDSAVKNDWNNWRSYFKKLYPQGYYIAVPEYHKSGGLHIHMCIGGVTFNDLDLCRSGLVCCHWVSKKCISISKFNKQRDKHQLLPTDGLPIYNVGAWNLGYSTATEIQSQGAVLNYIRKYIDKGGVDPRFCDNKRYWCSRNINRPIVESERYPHAVYDMPQHYRLYHPLEFAMNDNFYVFSIKSRGYILPRHKCIINRTIRKTILLRIVNEILWLYNAIIMHFSHI